MTCVSQRAAAPLPVMPLLEMGPQVYRKMGSLFGYSGRTVSDFEIEKTGEDEEEHEKMNLLQSMIIAFSNVFQTSDATYCMAGEKYEVYAMCFFPMVGIVIGVREYVLGNWILGRDYGVLFFSVCMTLLPILLTGGIHLDGFMDTSDARVLRGPGKKAGDLKRFPYRGICGSGTLHCIRSGVLRCGVKSVRKCFPVLAAGDSPLPGAERIFGGDIPGGAGGRTGEDISGWIPEEEDADRDGNVCGGVRRLDAGTP